MRRLAEIVATFGLVGYLRPAPGTWGSLAAVAAYWLLYMLGGWVLCLLALALVVPAGFWAARVMVEGGSDADPDFIVIDEVGGQWVALLPVILGAAHAGVPVLALWPGWITAFVAFRLFDIWKPGLVGRADRRHDVPGLMLDDLVAGVFAALVVVSLGVLAHGVLA